MSDSPVPQVQWFFGRVTSVTAELYVRLRFTRVQSPWRVVSASVSGPRSRYARTLETGAELTQSVADETLWHAKLEDPCFWTLREPYLYRLRLTLVAGGGATATLVCPLGVPVLMVRDGRLELAGKSWTLRAIRGDANVRAMLPACHASGTGLIVANPSDLLCEMASDEGVLLVTDLSALELSNCELELRRVARWPAVGMAVLPAAADFDSALRQETSHVIRAQHAPIEREQAPRDWAQVLIVPAEWINMVGGSRPGDCAVVAHSRAITLDQQLTPASAADNPATQVALGRQACDSLQAELAGQGSLVGYWVG